jgi:hypothetical protein
MELLETTVEGYVLTGKIKFTPETGGSFVGTVPEINGLLAAMGYAAVAVRTNMMSRLPYLEAKDTPIYCSPASETYWSM